MAQGADMLPSPRIFRSRWAALLWAGGIVWLAYDVAGSAPVATGNSAATSDTAAATDATGALVNTDDVQALTNFVQ